MKNFCLKIINLHQYLNKVKKRELQKNLFDYIGAGTISPQFLINKLYEEKNMKLDINFIELKSFYRKKFF